MVILDDYLPIDAEGQRAYRAFYTWTLEDATRVHDNWGSKPRHPNDHGPVFQWIAARKLKDLADDYLSSGNKALILEALYICNMNQMATPRWCSAAFISAYSDVWFRAALSWDDVFGKPHKKGIHSNDIRKRRNDAVLVYDRIKELNNIDKLPIDETMFNRVGRELGIGAKTKTAELYYLAKKHFDAINNTQEQEITDCNQEVSKDNA